LGAEEYGGKEKDGREGVVRAFKSSNVKRGRDGRVGEEVRGSSHGEVDRGEGIGEGGGARKWGAKTKNANLHGRLPILMNKGGPG